MAASLQERREIKMTNSEIKIGSRVIAPVTDKDGELAHVTGLLVSVNSRYAKIDLGDGEMVNVGKSKIEALESKKSTKKTARKVITCNACDTVAEDGDTECGECGESLEDGSVGRIADEYEYEKVKAASGRSSVDTGDDVALRLRGVDLNTAYKMAAETLEVTQKTLKARYAHLNVGHQRMCLGNLLRGHAKRQSAR